jgi:ATP-dependent RNA helicase DDX3X
MRYNAPTPIQAHAIPVALQHRDLMCCAQTGSGKTCAFILPLVATLAPKGVARTRSQQFVGSAAAPIAAILAPTRELAIQIHNEALRLCNASHLQAALVYGGANAKGQLQSLADGIDILVATPGRLQDFVDRGLVCLSQVAFLVLDEADRMLDMGFEPQIRRLHSTMPPAGTATPFDRACTFVTAEATAACDHKLI